jgi:hypothetical protein
MGMRTGTIEIRYESIMEKENKANPEEKKGAEGSNLQSLMMENV